MPLKLRIRPRETCNGFDLVDHTGAYDATENPGGYGPENGVAGPEDFTTDTLSVWAPGMDLSGEPLKVLSLKPVPEPDEDGCYTWSFTASDLGVPSIKSGVWYLRRDADTGSLTFRADVQPIFTDDVWEKLKPKVDAVDPTCGCGSGCTNPYDLFVALRTVQCSGLCDLKKAQRVIDWIYSQLKSCC